MSLVLQNKLDELLSRLEEIEKRIHDLEVQMVSAEQLANDTTNPLRPPKMPQALKEIGYTDPKERMKGQKPAATKRPPKK